ncbi:MAG TPA: hypothetical protein VK714_19515 [Myxococcota bacterium]|nr:hypothetical protein [Myxococcota bacterium]
MKTPSIKGSFMQLLVASVQERMKRGRITQGDLEAALTPEDLRILEEPVRPGSWYPVATEDRLLRLLMAKEGHGNVEYLIEAGRLSADRVIALGIYDQLKPENAQRLGDRFGPFLNTLAAAAHNFTRWRFTGTMERFRIEVTEAADYPDAVRYTGQGFIERCFAYTTGRRVTVTSTREAVDRVVFEGRSEPV